jgi:hypothetical protein
VLSWDDAPLDLGVATEPLPLTAEPAALFHPNPN